MPFSNGFRYSAAMNSTESISIEARSRTTLNLKVAAHRAMGWVKDGARLEVIDYTKRRPVKRYAQVMHRLPALSLRWLPVQ